MKKYLLLTILLVVCLGVRGQTETEPNDLPAQANIVSLPVSMSNAIGTNMDVDWFRVTTAKAGVLICDVPMNSSSITFVVGVYDATASTLIYEVNSFNIGDPVRNEAIIPAGTWYIKVSRYSVSWSSNNAYQLDLSIDTTDSCEINNSENAAYMLPFNTQVIAKKRGFNIPLNGNGNHSDKDYYKVVTSKCGVLQVIIPANNTNIRFDVMVKDSATGTQIAGETAANAGAAVDFEFMAPPATYYINVGNFLGNIVSPEPYFLMVHYDTTDEGGCNHDFNSAYAMPMCDTAIATIRPADSVDYYKVTGLGNMFTAKVTNVPSNLALRITAINSNQIAITSATGAAGQDVSLSIPTVNNDVYYFKVEDMNGQKNNNAYRFAVSDTSCTPVVGLSDIRNDKPSIYPNPNNGKFRVMLDEAATITISNTLGQLVEKQFAQKGITEFELNKQPGIYYLTVSSGNAPVTQKIIIQ